MRVSIVQMQVTEEKIKNIAHAWALTEQAAKDGADVVILPEMFACPYENSAFRENAEEAGGMIWQALSDMARTNGVSHRRHVPGAGGEAAF